ncbi:hypothetical protein ACFPRL_15385 [Pseudoclavibacter helvolus]
MTRSSTSTLRTWSTSPTCWFSSSSSRMCAASSGFGTSSPSTATSKGQHTEVTLTALRADGAFGDCRWCIRTIRV